jgi:chaperone required for assembly of F1-ATPase
MKIIETQEGFQLEREGNILLTPAKNPFIIPTRALAEAIANEWAPIKRVPRPEQIPLTQYINTALDIVAKDRAKTQSEAASYLPTDLLVIRTTDPVELSEQQAKLWQPWLDWAAKTHGIHLKPAYNLVPDAPAPESLATLERALSELDIFHLTAVSVGAGLFGSIILALAVGQGELAANTALQLALLEESHQTAKWGAVPEQQHRQDNLAAESKILAKFLSLIDDGAGLEVGKS